MSPIPKVSIIVAVYNAERTLTACLDSLLALDFPQSEREIIVVDNHSTDRSKDIILKYPVTYLFESNRGRAWARNKGIKHARGEYIAFTDSDCIVTKDWLTNLLEGFKGNDNIAVCGGKILAYRQDTLCERYVEDRGLLNQEVAVKGEYPQCLPFALTANAIFRKDTLREVGYFDEDLKTTEDAELGWRILFKGREITYAPEAVVYHQHRQTFRALLSHSFEVGRSCTGLMAKYEKLYDAMKAPIRIWDSFELYFNDAKRFLKKIVLDAAQGKTVFLFIDFCLKVTYHAGYFCSTTGATVLRKETVSPAKMPVEHFFKTLVFHNDKGHWLLDRQATWFLHEGFIQLVIFFRGLHVYKLNKTATRIWLSLLKTGNLKETIEELAAFYSVSQETIKEDADTFMAMLEGECVLKKYPAPAIA